MLKHLFHSLLFVMLLPLSGSADNNTQDAGKVIEIVKNSMTSGDAADISEYFDNTVDITFESNHSTYSKSHALVVLNDFYARTHPQSFKIEYKGKSPQTNANYIIGTIYTHNGNYKVYLYIKQKGTKQVFRK